MIKKLLTVIIMCIFGFVTYSAVFVYQTRAYTKEVLLKDYQSNRWRFYNGKPITIKIKYRDLSPSKLDWLLAVQDPGFYKHNGIDNSTPGVGFSTITQALAKNIYFNHFESGFDNVKLSLIAFFVVDSLLNKKEQLEIFMNSAYLGNFKNKAVYGFDKAAKVYYKKKFSALSGDEYLSLVAMLIAPSSFNVFTNPKKNRERVSRIKQVILGEYVPTKPMDVFYNLK